MGRFSWVCCAAIFLVLGIIFLSINAEERNVDDRLTSSDSNRDIHWYIRRKPGIRYVLPRIQRKKRSPSYEESYRTPALEQEQIDSLMDSLQEPPWTVVTINEGKRHTVNFTPRLGRESGEESDAAENWLHDSELMSQRSPPFAPRLGRRTSTYYFDPRLGKRNDLQKQL